MKNPIAHINKIFDHRIRLGIMSALMVNETVDYTVLKELLQVTDGNLASHIKTLESELFILVNKRFVGKKPNTSYQITLAGRRAFLQHLQALEQLINNSK